MPNMAGARDRPRDQSWGDIRRAAADRESGAAEIARRVAESLVALPRPELTEAVGTLIRGHPSMAPLWRLAAEALTADDHAEAARSFAARLAEEPGAVAAAAAPLLRSPVVTISYSSTVVAAVAAAGVLALCARSEPGGEGEETAARLKAMGREARVINDREAVRAARIGRMVVTGADAVGPGGVVNKVGTRDLAENAAVRGTPCYVVAGSSKFLAADLPAPRPFERTPLALFTAVLTNDGAKDPDEAAGLARRHALAPELSRLLAEGLAEH
jgi:translation initiation factor 2B subunit (eIF-2B alpha/beta/delta family)